LTAACHDDATIALALPRRREEVLVTSSAALAISDESAPEDLSGSLIAGRYRLRERIGRGGMATVYRGFDAELSRAVAVKILHAGRASEDYRRRMLQEGRAAVRAEHPHLMRVFDVGRVEDTTFLVMELLVGCSLADRLRASTRMPWAEALRLLLPAVDAFAALHAAGLVHRDIKPANLFIRRRDGADAIVVVDFGLAKMSSELFDQAGLVETKSGTLLGTPMYMAPEHGNAATADARSDIYSLGVTLYEALAGRLPFPPERGDNWVSLLTKHMYEEVPPLPDEVPPTVGEVVMRALAKRPEDRFETMEALAAALRACLGPGAATPHACIGPGGGATPRVRDGAARGRTSWILAAAALAVVVANAATMRAPATTPLALRVAPDDPIGSEPRFIAPVVPERAPTARPPESPPRAPERVDHRAWLARLGPAVIACMRTSGDPDAPAVRVALLFDEHGGLAAAELAGRRGVKVGTCIVERLAGQRFPGRGRIAHTFRRAEI
jgi:hypothetical protein